MAELQDNSILARLLAAVESLAEMQVVTCVGTVELMIDRDPGSGMRASPVAGLKLDGIYTEMNLVTGDIVTLHDDKYLADDSPVRAIHEAQVANARQIVTTNVEAILKLVKEAGAEVREYLGQQESRRANNAPPPVPPIAPPQPQPGN